MRIPLITVIATGLAIGAAHAKPAPQDAAGNAGAQTQAITIKQPSEATIRARNEKIKNSARMAGNGKDAPSAGMPLPTRDKDSYLPLPTRDKDRLLPSAALPTGNLPKPPGLDPEDQPPHHPKDPLPPTPRPLPRAVDVPTIPHHIPRDPGIGDGTPAHGGNPVEPALPCPPGQMLVSLKNGQTACAVAQPADTTMPNQTARPIVKPDVHGCVPPQRWDPNQQKCVVGLVIKDDPTRNTARQAEGGTPISAPTHTVPVAPASRLTIKTKSSPPYAPQPPVSIEERTANPAPGMGKPNAGALGATPYQPKCPPGMVWVNGDPRGDKRGHCEIPKD